MITHGDDGPWLRLSVRGTQDRRSSVGWRGLRPALPFGVHFFFFFFFSPAAGGLFFPFPCSCVNRNGQQLLASSSTTRHE